MSPEPPTTAATRLLQDSRDALRRNEVETLVANYALDLVQRAHVESAARVTETARLSGQSESAVREVLSAWDDCGNSRKTGVRPRRRR